jgi:triosephosphate isomerase
LVIGYEPLWAIGAGRPPSPAEITEVHCHIRTCLVADLGTEAREVRILYGGSVNPANAAGILQRPEVGGAVVGGASLTAADFRLVLTAVPL